MLVGRGESEYRPGPGDSLLLDGERLRGPNELVQLPIRFLAVTAYPNTHPERTGFSDFGAICSIRLRIAGGSSTLSEHFRCAADGQFAYTDVRLRQ